MSTNKLRNEDVIYFNDDNTASIKRVNGRRVKIQDQYFEKEDVITTIHQAIIKDQLKEAMRVAGEEKLEYTFRFSEYDKRREENKKSVVKIVVPREYYQKNDPSIAALNAITKAHITMKKKNRKRIAMIAATALILVGPKLGDINKYLEQDSKEKYQQEMLLQNEKAEQLTGKTIVDIVDTNEQYDINKLQNSNLNEEENQNMELENNTYVK